MYEITKEVKILRRKHKVTFRAGTTVEDLMAMLAMCPKLATVDEVLDCVEEGSDVSSIEFHEESRVE